MLSVTMMEKVQCRDC